VYAGINLANVLNREHDAEKSREAIRVLRAVLDLAPTIPAAWNNLGIAYNIVGDYAKAVDAYERAVDLFPEFADAYYNMGIVYDEWGRYDKAIGAYQKGLQCSPNSAKILYNFGLTHAHAQQFQEAESTFLRLTEMTPDDHRIWNTLGHILCDRGKYKEARMAFDRALAIDAGLLRPRNGLGAVKLNARDFDGAADCFHRVITGHPDDSAASVVETLLKHTDPASAMQVADILVERLPENPAPLIVRAHVRLHANRGDGAITDCTQAIRMDDSLAEPYTIRGIAHLLERNYTAAVKDLKQALALKPDAVYPALWCWSAWMAVGEADVASHELAAVADNVGRDSWEGNLLRLLRGGESPDDLLEIAQNDERRCEAYYYIGERALGDGNADEANDWFRKCLETRVGYFLEPLLAQGHLDSD
jgi:superkiller protein 3